MLNVKTKTNTYFLSLYSNQQDINAMVVIPNYGIEGKIPIEVLEHGQFC